MSAIIPLRSEVISLYVVPSLQVAYPISLRRCDRTTNDAVVRGLLARYGLNNNCVGAVEERRPAQLLLELCLMHLSPSTVPSDTRDHIAQLLACFLDSVDTITNSTEQNERKLRSEKLDVMLAPLMEASTLLAPCRSFAPLNLFRRLTGALARATSGKPLLSAELAAPVLSAMAKLLDHTDTTVVSAALSVLANLSDGGQCCIQMLLNTGVLPRTTQLLSSSDVCLVTLSARIIGNTVTGNDAQTQCVINAGALAYFPVLVTHSSCDLRKEACWALSNIAAGSVEPIQAVIDNRLFPLIMNCMVATETSAVKTEAMWTIVNATFGATKEQIRYLVGCGVLDSLCNALTCDDDTIACPGSYPPYSALRQRRTN